MAAKNLTKASIDRIPKPRRGITEISDTTKGLFIYVTPTGTRSWYVVYRVAGMGGEGRVGRRTKMRIGIWPVMNVETARAECGRIISLSASGTDPKQDQAAQMADQAAQYQGTVKVISDTWLDAMKAGQITGARKRSVSVSTYRNRETVLRLHIVPRIGLRPMEQITAAELGRVLNTIDSEGGPVDGALKTLKGLWSFAKSRGLAQGEAPTVNLTPRQVKKYNARSLGDAELKSIWEACEQIGYPFGCAIQLLMLTGQRRSEIAEAQWDWYDPERGTLTIPASLVKNRAGAHEVVLSQQSIGILEHTVQIHGHVCPKSPYIFTSSRGLTPISGWTTTLNRLRKLRMGEATDEPQPWRLHDLRHTFITRARYGDQNADGEVVWSAALDVIQASVNHSMNEGVTGIYDHSDIALRYRLKRRELAAWWSVKLAGIVG